MCYRLTLTALVHAQMAYVIQSVSFRGVERKTRDRILQRYEYVWRTRRDYLKRPEDDFMMSLRSA